MTALRHFIYLLARLTFIFALLGLIGAYSARAGTRPAWTTSLPPETGEYKFYVGRASHAKNETDGFNVASRDAIEKAILENFGFRTRVARETSESLSTAEVDTRVQELSRAVEMHGFDQVDEYREEKSGGVDAWVLFRFRKSAIAAELARLAAHRSDDSSPPSYSETGSDPRGGVLEIVTEPAGARVSIDGAALGLLTPLRINGQLKPGKHFIHLDLSTREPADAEVTLLPGHTVHVKRNLRKTHAWLRIVTTPAGANVALNGKLLGVSPFETKVPAGEKIRIEVSHRETGNLSQEVELTRNEQRTLRLELVPRPEFRTAPAPATEPESASPKGLYASLYLPNLLGQPAAPSEASDPDAGLETERYVATASPAAPTWSLRLPFEVMQTPFAGQTGSRILYGAGLEFHLLPRLDLELTYLRGGTYTAVAVNQGAAIVDLQGFLAGLRVTLFRRAFFQNDFLALRGNWAYYVSQATPYGGGAPTSGSLQSAGGEMTYGWLFPLKENRCFFSISFFGGAQYFYRVSDQLPATLPLTGGAELALGF